MSKNNDRYKEDYSHVDIDQLDEVETKKFEKFRPKKKDKNDVRKKKIKNGDEE
jgi:hypothetical protein